MMKNSRQSPAAYEKVIDRGRGIATDGGAAAAHAQNADIEPGEQMTAGGGFDQFVAQARFARAQSQGREVEAQAAGDDVRTFRANALLRDDEWRQLDENVVNVAQRNLTVIDDLRNSGLTRNTDLGTLLYEYETSGAMDDAQVDMGAESRGKDDVPGDLTPASVPLPIVHKSFHLNRRTILAARQNGRNIQTDAQSQAARAVMQGLENMVFNGWDGSVRGNTVHGFTNHPDANTIAGSNWTDTTNVSADEVRSDIIDTIEALENDNYGPEGTGFNFYLGRGAYQALRRRDTGTDQERGLLERVNEEFGDIVDITLAPYLADGEGVMFKPVNDVVELIVASDVQNVEWSSHADMTTHVKIMASMTPVVKSDDDGQSGVGVLSGLTG